MAIGQSLSCIITVAVRFSLLPSQQVATQRCLLNQTVAELRHQFAVEMKMDDELIQLLFDGKVILFFKLIYCIHCSIRCDLISV